jgi:hypothetical protein
LLPLGRFFSKHECHPGNFKKPITIVAEECPIWVYAVEKLEKNRGLYFCRKPKCFECLTALGM